MSIYNSDLHLDMLPVEMRVATYRRGDEYVVLVYDDDSPHHNFIVATFRDHQCNNAQGYLEYEKAWEFFDEVKADMRKATPEVHLGVNNEDILTL